MSINSYSEVIEGLKRLKLSTIRHHLDDYLRLAETRSMSHLEFLTGLVKEELQGREESNYRRRLRAARFPMIKRLEEFDFTFQPSISENRVNSLRECRWIENAENVVFAGQAGVGKTHLSIGLGVEAIERGYKVYFSTVADLLDKMALAATTNQLFSLQKKLLKFDGLILDELGYERISRPQGNFLFRLISKAYENTSIIVTTNKDFAGWADIFEDQVQVSALLDRLLHHVALFACHRA
jgi:DNA replication protein DnaC